MVGSTWKKRGGVAVINNSCLWKMLTEMVLWGVKEKNDLTYYVANRRQNVAAASIYSPSVKELTLTLAFGFIPLKNNPLNSESIDC